MITQSNAERVRKHTSDEVNSKLQRQADMRIAYFEKHPERIGQRLEELDREWDIERALQVNSSALTLFGLSMTLLRGRRWLLLPMVVQGFFMQHALEGYCPPLPVLRRMGFRTQSEIDRERHALEQIQEKSNPKRRKSMV